MSFKKMRKASGLSQYEVADALGIKQASVCQWETGKTAPTARLLPKVAKLYGCTIDELLREDEEESGNERI